MPTDPVHVAARALVEALPPTDFSAWYHGDGRTGFDWRQCKACGAYDDGKPPVTVKHRSFCLVGLLESVQPKLSTLRAALAAAKTETPAPRAVLHTLHPKIKKHGYCCRCGEFVATDDRSPCRGSQPT